MKRTLLLLAGLLCAGIAAAGPLKYTELYAVRGADSLYLDRYRAQTAADTLRPCMIFVFGGGFAFGERDAETYMPFFDHMTSRGWDVVSIDYRLGMKNAGAASMDMFVPMLANAVNMAVEDLYAATAFAVSKAAEWGIDPSRIAACGSSAGAITVLQGEYGICNGVEAAAALLPENFNYAGVISFAGAIFDIGERLVWSKAPAPVMMFHGSTDSNVPYGALTMDGAGIFGSSRIAESLESLPSPFWFCSVKGARHEMAVDPMNDDRCRIDSFLDRMVLGGERSMIVTEIVPIGASESDKTPAIEDFIRANYAE